MLAKTDMQMPDALDLPVLDSPELREAEGKLQSLWRRRTQARRALDEARGTLNELAAGPRGDAVSEAAMRLLDSSDTETATVSVVERTRAEVLRLQTALNVIERAVTLQTERVAKARYAASREACQNGLRDQYTDIIQRTAEAAKALSALVAEEQAFRDGLRDRGISFGADIPPANFRHIGKLTDKHSYIRFWLRDAFERGYLTEGYDDEQR